MKVIHREVTVKELNKVNATENMELITRMPSESKKKKKREVTVITRSHSKK